MKKLIIHIYAAILLIGIPSLIKLERWYRSYLGLDDNTKVALGMISIVIGVLIFLYSTYAILEYLDT